MLFLILVLAGVVTYLASPWVAKAPPMTRPRPEGLVVMFAVGLAVCFGLALSFVHDLNFARSLASVDANGQPIIPSSVPQFLPAVELSGLVLMVFILALLRGVGGLPVWTADAAVVICAILAMYFAPDLRVQLFLARPGEVEYRAVSCFCYLGTVTWIWAMARSCAGLNRVHPVAGGYLGLVGFAVVILVWLKGESTDPFCSIVPAAIAGAGLTTFAIGLRSPKYNLGWSTSLSLGFALGMAIAMSLLKGTLPAVFAISLPTLGLPLLDIGFIRARAAINGQPFNMRPERMRLYRVLLFRGLSRTKVALLYFCLGGYFCLLAILAEVGFFSGVHNWFVQLLFVLVLAALGAIGPIVFFSVARILMRRQPGEQLPERLDAFGVRICPVSMEEALGRIEDYILSGQPHHVVTSDANAILTSRNDPEYAEILRNAALITPDGFGVVWGARLMNLPIYERVTGVDMVTGICAMAAKKGYRLFILGSAPGVAQTAADKLTEAYPGVIFAGTHHGMILKDPEAMAEAMRQIKEARPHVLFVAMGIPLQEKFISRNLAELGVPVSLGVGGSFDVYSGKYNRAPVYMQRAGLEWLYRVWIDPSRWRRMGYVPKFMVIALRTWIMSFRGPQKPAGDAL